MATGSVNSFIYTLCRHGETSANKDGIIQGQTDVPLSTAGEEQARLLGERFSSETFTHVYSSDLSRAKQTAEAVIKCCRVGSPVTITTDTRIRERGFGDFEGRTLAEFREKSKPVHVPLYLRSPPTVETVEDFMTRTVSFFNDVCSTVAKSTTPTSPVIDSKIISDYGRPLQLSDPTAHVLVAAHGGVVRMHLMYFETLGCRIDGSTTRSTPNTALTSFLVSVDKDGKCCGLECLCLHDNSHITNKTI